VSAIHVVSVRVWDQKSALSGVFLAWVFYLVAIKRSVAIPAYLKLYIDEQDLP
jgi:hypothetical protein